MFTPAEIVEYDPRAFYLELLDEKRLLQEDLNHREEILQQQESKVSNITNEHQSYQSKVDQLDIPLEYKSDNDNLQKKSNDLLKEISEINANIVVENNVERKQDLVQVRIRLNKERAKYLLCLTFLKNMRLLDGQITYFSGYLPRMIENRNDAWNKLDHKESTIAYLLSIDHELQQVALEVDRDLENGNNNESSSTMNNNNNNNNSEN